MAQNALSAAREDLVQGLLAACFLPFEDRDVKKTASEKRHRAHLLRVEALIHLSRRRAVGATDQVDLGVMQNAEHSVDVPGKHGRGVEANVPRKARKTLLKAPAKGRLVRYEQVRTSITSRTARNRWLNRGSSMLGAQISHAVVVTRVGRDVGRPRAPPSTHELPPSFRGLARRRITATRARRNLARWGHYTCTPRVKRGTGREVQIPGGLWVSGIGSRAHRRAARATSSTSAQSAISCARRTSFGRAGNLSTAMFCVCASPMCRSKASDPFVTGGVDHRRALAPTCSSSGSNWWPTANTGSFPGPHASLGRS